MNLQMATPSVYVSRDFATFNSPRVDPLTRIVRLVSLPLPPLYLCPSGSLPTFVHDQPALHDNQPIG